MLKVLQATYQPDKNCMQSAVCLREEAVVFVGQELKTAEGLLSVFKAILKRQIDLSIINRESSLEDSKQFRNTIV